MTLTDFDKLLRWAVSKGKFTLADKFYRQACYLFGDTAADRIMSQLIMDLEG